MRAVTQAIRKDAPGYVATVAFLLAYALTVSDAVPALASTLNVAGGVTSAFYLRGKNAVPSVISNVIWVVITLVGLMAG